MPRAHIDSHPAIILISDDMHSAGTLRHTISVYLSQPDSSLAHVKSQKPKSSTIYNKISYELHNLTYKPGQEQEPQEKYLGVKRPEVVDFD